jgi:2-polyprenyl-3-methyl-5-hydroxy-6-metoxy-1,4-benzoquinol methylase
MDKVLMRPCPVCESQIGRTLHVQRFAVIDEFGSQEEVDIVACGRCGMVFSDLETDQDALDRSYEERSKYADMSLYAQDDGLVGEQDGEAPDPSPDATEAPFDLDRLQETATWLSEWFDDRGLRVLDAGCATGSLLGFLGAQGWQHLVGLDPSPMAAVAARRVYGVEAHAASFLDPPATIGQFDLVILSHVLEHLVEVQSAVGSMLELTKPGGNIYLEVPDAERYVDHLIAPVHDFNSEHVNHFSGRLLDLLMRRRGFESVTLGRKVVEIAPDRPYPAVFGVWRRPDEPSRATAVTLDEGLADAIEQYVAESANLMGRIDQHLRDELSGHGEVVVWGAGNLVMKLLTDTVLGAKDVVAVVDGSPQRQGLHLAGVRIVSPTALDRTEPPIVVASLHHDEAIVRAIVDEIGLPNPVVTLAGIGDVG